MLHAMSHLESELVRDSIQWILHSCKDKRTLRVALNNDLYIALDTVHNILGSQSLKEFISKITSGRKQELQSLFNS